MKPLLAQSQTHARALVDQIIRDYAAGISARLGEAAELAELWCLEIDVPAAAKVAREAREALDAPPLQPAQEEAKPVGQKLIRRLPKLGLLPISGPLPKPPPQEKTETNQEPQIDAALKVFEEPQSKSEPVVPTGFTQSPTIAPVVADEGALCLDPAAPFDNAQKLVSLRAWHPGERIRTWQFWQKSFWQWSGTHWCEVDDDTVRASIWHELNAAEKVLKGGKLARYEPKMSDVNATLDALKAAVNLPASEENAMPGWFGSSRPDGDLRELVVCKNGVLHIPTRSRLDHTPRFWSPNALDIAYDPKAKAPRFKQFLDEIWPGDEQAQQCLLEMFGLCLTDITKYQKAFMFVGPRRGGRGTIGRVLRGLIGADNYIGTSLKAFSEQFGMENFVGKKVAVFSDARLDGVLQRNLSTMTERLLMITGEDEIHINRKNKKYWNGKLATKVVIFSNELLRFQDESGALAGRFLTFRMQQSFYGREDENLTDKLLAERPGILNLALDALDELRSRGKLLQSGSGVEMAERLGDLTSDVKVFVEECCNVGVSFEVRVSEIFTRWQDWCTQHNTRHGWGSNQFSEKLRSVIPTITSSRPRKDNPDRLTVLYGVGLKKKLPLLQRPVLG